MREKGDGRISLIHFEGFFRRSVQSNSNYVCTKEKTCIITAKTRNCCQYCRFQKCLRVGMKKEAIRAERNQKRKERDDARYQISKKQ
ncbi:unnamed protein product [Dracunculus medinensis]|uniref:Nuclear receptor domain-containing protein n=1 Tax=Dracunculus medinensis TaxID=318479 RepID=A0A0N4U9A4_DRAME|nr:unnamed protein product [Dracunculus medinensis]